MINPIPAQHGEAIAMPVTRFAQKLANAIGEPYAGATPIAAPASLIIPDGAEFAVWCPCGSPAGIASTPETAEMLLHRVIDNCTCAALKCCDTWIAYPTPGITRECPQCHSAFTVTAAGDVYGPAGIPLPE